MFEAIYAEDCFRCKKLKPIRIDFITEQVASEHWEKVRERLLNNKESIVCEDCR
jgi:hypothetical protein